jgi:hypothetical protein
LPYDSRPYRLNDCRLEHCDQFQPRRSRWKASATRSAIADHRAIPQRRIRLTRSRMPPLQGPSEHFTRCDPASAQPVPRWSSPAAKPHATPTVSGSCLPSVEDLRRRELSPADRRGSTDLEPLRRLTPRSSAKISATTGDRRSSECAIVPLSSLRIRDHMDSRPAPRRKPSLDHV